MATKSSGLGYAIAFGLGLVTLTVGTFGIFWQVTGNEVRRSATAAAEAAELRKDEPVAVSATAKVDTTTPWRPTPKVALLDTLYLLRRDGRLLEALTVLERWLVANPADLPLRLAAARLAFEAQRFERGVFHYRRYLSDGDDLTVLREAVDRILSEMEPAASRRELATMLTVDDTAFTVRFGLARATAEAGDPVTTDSILRPILPLRDRRVDDLRLLVRRSQNPDTPTAMRWVQEYPQEALYRLVLARVLSRGGQPGQALQHYVAAFSTDTSLALRLEASDVAVAGGSLDIASGLLEEILDNETALLSYARVRAKLGDGTGAVRAFERLMALNPSDALFAEARGALSQVDDPRTTMPLLSRLVAFRPEDNVLRMRYAQDLDRTSAFLDAEVQYDTLLMRIPSASMLMARARLRAARNDLPGALADAAASEAREPSVDAALLQGDIHRWRGERNDARLAYDRAALRAPDNPQLAEGRRLLLEQRRSALSFEPGYGRAANVSGLSDSDGFDSFTLRTQVGFAPLTDESVMIVGGEVRRTTGALGVPISGFGGDVAITRAFGKLNIFARAGAVSFGGAPAATALLEVTRRSPTSSLRGSLGRQPAYESLRSPEVVATDRIESATTLLGSVNAQLSPRLEVYLQADHARLHGGNSRTVVAGAARRSVGGPFAMLYTASAATFSSATAQYWSPSLFVTQGLALDVRQNRPTGWSAGARLAPAYAWVRESAPGRPVGTQAAIQGTFSADATLRRPGWEAEIFAGYGQDRAGTYRAGFGGVRLRVPR